MESERLTQDPWEDICNGRKDSCCSQEDPKVPYTDRFASSEEYIANEADGGRCNDCETSLLSLVRNIDGEDGD